MVVLQASNSNSLIGYALDNSNKFNVSVSYGSRNVRSPNSYYSIYREDRAPNDPIISLNGVKFCEFRACFKCDGII